MFGKPPGLIFSIFINKHPSDNCYATIAYFMRIHVWFECLLLQFKSLLDFTIGAIKGTVKALLLAPLHSLVKDSLYNIIFHLQEFEINHMTWLNGHLLTLSFTFVSHFWIFLIKPLSNQKLANLMLNNTSDQMDPHFLHWKENLGSWIMGYISEPEIN